jgi:hypothetical protein
VSESMHPAVTQPTINLYLDPWGWRENCERQTMHATHEDVADEFGIARADLAAGLAGEPVEPEFVVRAL